MNTDIKKLLMLLVAAGFDKSEFENLIYSLKNSDIKKISAEFDRTYRTLLSSRETSEKTYYKKQYDDRYNDRSVAEKIYSLLIEESGLSARQSFAGLEGILKETYPNKLVATPNPKSGFTSWVRMLSKDFSESELLHVASRLRNQIVHNSDNKDDWTLKE